MKTPTLIIIPFLVISLSACIFDSNKSDNKTDKAPEKNILATESDYIPKDGDQVKSLYTYTITVDGLIAESDGYYKTTSFNIINELPQKYGYQHHESGPYLQANFYNDRPTIGVEATSVDYHSLSPSGDLLIEHDLNDHYYSTIEFTDRSETSSDTTDGLIVEGEVISATKNNILFDEVSGNEIGYETLTVTLTALNSEEIIIQAGIFTAAKAAYHAEQSTIINASPEDSSTLLMNGYFWFDSKTSSTLKYSLDGTYTAHHDLEKVIRTTNASELVNSSEYNNTLSAQSSARRAASTSLPLRKRMPAADIILETHLISQELENRISMKNYSRL